MTYEEAIYAEEHHLLVNYDGHKYRMIDHKAINGGGHFIFTIQRVVLGIPFQPVDIGEQTLATLVLPERSKHE